MHSTCAVSWHALPNEMQLAVIDFLDEDDVGKLSMVDQKTYRVCIPARFRVCLHVIVGVELLIDDVCFRKSD